NGNSFYGGGNQPISTGWTEHGGGSFFMASTAERRSSFADANANHSMLYSRHNKSRYFCASCHDVSNSVLANLAYDGTPPNDGSTVLPSETQPAHSFGHIERTFSEFMLSDYGNGAGIVGRGAFDPNSFTTSRPNNAIATCQDCHMADRVGKGCDKNNGILRPTGSTEHPKSGQPLHDLTGGNMWVTWLLASSQPGSPNYDAFNAQLLGQGSGVLTLDLNAGEGVDAVALLAGVNRAQGMLQSAAAITNLSYNNGSGAVVFRIENDTGHKLISGYPEGRRMFANVRVYLNGAVVYEVNPYDGGAGTLKGLPLTWSPNSPPLGAGEVHEDPLVYEVTQSSSLTGEGHTFHIALATERYKDNRIPPVGFRINEASARLAQPYQGGSPALGLFTTAEYAGGYDEVQLTVPSGADGVLVSLYYQTTSREYVEFLRDEINGTATTLSLPVPSGESAAYIIQTDPFFNQLAAWGTTIWQLWDHNRNVPGAEPVLMTQAVFGDISGPCAAPSSNGVPCNDGDACTVGDACLNSLCVSGNPVVCTALDDCHDAGVCNSQTGVCTDPVKPNGSPCPGGSCQGGVCIPGGTGGGGQGGLGGQGGVGGAGGGTSSGSGGVGGQGGAGGAGGSTSSGTAGAGGQGGSTSSGTAGAGGLGGAGGQGGSTSSGTAGAGGSTSTSSTSSGTGGTTSSSSTSGTGGAATRAEPEFEGGCDCRAVSRNNRPARWWLLASLALGLAGRRRSRRPRA
ncbi:MAG: hypothetical protein JRI68_26245, partial [Deltaproteobacteria bacterium]|nr:hypothetical protein [Deltaproteobacteria bacterium]